MIKELLFTLTLLLPVLAYAGNAGAEVPVQIFRAESDPTPPTATMAAGFTTLAANYDFSQPQYAVQSTWLDCDNTNDSVVWHRGSPGITSPLPCNINQEIDPTTRQSVLAMTWLTSYNGQQSGNASFVSMQTYNNGGRRSFTAFPNGAYFEATYRNDGTYDNGNNNGSGPDGLYFGSTTNGPGDNGAGLNVRFFEFDIGELHEGKGGFAGGHLFNWGVAVGNHLADTWISYNGNNRLPAGWSITTYHKYGLLVTSDGRTAVYACAFVDDLFQGHCVDMQATSDEYAMPSRLIVWTGGSDPGQNKKLYVSSIRVWSCPNWANQIAQQKTPVCTGSTLFNSGGLTYWH